MTREEANFIGGMNMCDEISNEAYRKIMCHCEEQEPCEDCISRQSVIDCFKKWQPYMATRLHEFENELFELPSVNPQKSDWIPVSERLPTKEEYIANNGLFIVSDGNRNYAEYFDIYDSKKFGELIVFGFRVDKCVIAWMPLPVEPYKAESEVKE